jgi:hypothetical protein
MHPSQLSESSIVGVSCCLTSILQGQHSRDPELTNHSLSPRLAAHSSNRIPQLPRKLLSPSREQVIPPDELSRSYGKSKAKKNLLQSAKLASLCENFVPLPSGKLHGKSAKTPNRSAWTGTESNEKRTRSYRNNVYSVGCAEIFGKHRWNSYYVKFARLKSSARQKPFCLLCISNLFHQSQIPSQMRS